MVWGTGEQIRNWTYVDDIVRRTILAADRIEDGTTVNLGTMERIRGLDAAKQTLAYAGHDAEIELRPEMPTEALNRVADNCLAKRLVDRESEIAFAKGRRRTIDW